MIRGFMVAALACCLVADRALADDLNVSAWEMNPYRVRVVVAMASRPRITPRLAAAIGVELTDRTDASIGAAWNLEIKQATGPLRDAMLVGLGALSHEQLPEGILAGECDKLIFLVVDATPGTFEVFAREFDVRTQQWGGTVARRVVQASLLPVEAFRAVWTAFAPLALVEDAKGDVATLRLRAAAIGVRDASLQFAKPGSTFRPVVRLNDRLGNVRKIQPIEWTFLTVDKVDGQQLSAKIHTGLRSPLGGRRRGRIEQLALGINRFNEPTRLTVQSRGTPPRPLAGYEVHAYGPDSRETKLLGLTGRDGTLEIAPGPNALRVLLVRHGNELLARLPVVPGLMPDVVAAVPDDDVRLDVEGFITGLQERFVDLIAKRQVLAARIRNRIDQGKWDDATALIAQLRELDARPHFEQLRQQRQVTSVPDARAQRRIDKLFGDTQEVVSRFLDIREADALEQELNEARKAPTAPAETASPAPSGDTKSPPPAGASPPTAPPVGA